MAVSIFRIFDRKNLVDYTFHAKNNNKPFLDSEINKFY